MSTISEKLEKIIDAKNSIKEAILAKGVEITNTTPLSDYSGKIANIQTKENISDTFIPTANFYNLSGDIIYQYTYSLISSMTDLPPVPEYTDELCSTAMSVLGWSHELSDVKRALRDGYNYDIGPKYKTPNHETRIYINIVEDNYNLTLAFKGISGEGTGEHQVIWGDGNTSTCTTNDSSNHIVLTHTFNTGRYCIVIKPKDAGTCPHIELYYGRSTPCLTHYISDTSLDGSYIEKIEFGDNVLVISQSAFRNSNNLKTVLFSDSILSLGSYSFQYNTQLKIVVLPKNINISNHAFLYCVNLKYVVIPEHEYVGNSTKGLLDANIFFHCINLKRLTTPINNIVMGNSMCNECISLESYSNQRDQDREYATTTDYHWDLFRGCRNLKNIILGEGMTHIPNNMFQDCDGLELITIPSTIRSIGHQAFLGCTNLRIVDLSRLSSRPDLNKGSGSTQYVAFTFIDKNCVFRIKSSLKSDYINGTNWSVLFSENPLYKIEEV